MPPGRWELCAAPAYPAQGNRAFGSLLCVAFGAVTLLIDTRNVLVHGYFQLSLATLRETAEKDLPALRPLIAELLATLR